MDQTPPNPASTQPQSTDAGSPLASLEGALRRARKVARTFLIIQRLALIVAMAVVCGLCIGVLDYLVRTPWMMRTLLLVAGMCASAWALVKFVRPAIAFRPSLTEMALRLEATDDKGTLGLKGNLASGLELARTPHLIGVGKELAQQLVNTLTEKARSVRVLGQMMAPKLTLQRVGIAVLTLVPVFALMIKAPQFASIGAMRVLTPWRDVQWPKRYAIGDVTAAKVHPTTAALPLRAVLMHSPKEQGKSDVVVEYRASGGTGDTKDSWSGKWERVLLTGQGNVSEEMSLLLGGVRGELYERLLEPAAIDPRLAMLTDQVVTLEYRIIAGDDETPVRTIMLARPPTIARAKIAVTPPEYAKAENGFGFVWGEHDLSASDGTRGTVGPVLAGSRIEMTLGFSKPISPPNAGAAQTLAGAGTDANIAIEAKPTEWVLRWTAKSPVKFTVQAADEHALALTDDATFRFDTVDDASPSAAVLTPASDESVLPSATITIKAEARDDVALAEAGVEHQKLSPAKGSESRTAMPLADPVKFADMAGNTLRQEMVETILELSSLDLKAGDELWITAIAKDAYEFEGASHKLTRSAARKLRIITDSEFIEQIRSELNTIRQSAMRIDSDQAQTRNKTAEARVQQDAAESQRRQDAISDRLKPPAEALKRLQERFERNNATDTSMSATLKDAQDAVNKASKASQDAAENLKQAAQAKGQETALSAESQKRIGEAKAQQDQVRRELDRLMEMLGQSQDTWAARRQIEKLLAEQQRVTQESRKAGKDTAGKKAEELTPQEAADLNRVAQEQRELSQRVQNAIDQMETQAQALNKSSPAQSQAMKESAQKGRQSQAADKQKKAAEQLEKNQTQTANALQQQAEQALSDMLKSLEQSEKRRDEELRRVLADIRDSLQHLVERQDGEIKSLATAMREQKATGLDGPMISLHEATTALNDDILKNKEIAEVAVPVGEAGESQAGAIGALRESPAALAKADGGERNSLQRLKDAVTMIDELQKKSEQKDLARQRDELRKAYEEILARQVEVKAAVQPLLETINNKKDLSRRERQVAKELGIRQEAVRTDLYTLREKTEFLAEAKVFEYAHERLDAAGKSAGATLALGNATTELGRQEATMVRTLDALIEALKELKQKEDFRDAANEDGGGGGGNSGGGKKEKTIPPIAELRLLRMMQQEAFETTRAAAEVQDAAAIESAMKLQHELTAQAKKLAEAAKDQGGGANEPEKKPEPLKNDGPEPKKDESKEEGK